MLLYYSREVPELNFRFLKFTFFEDVVRKMKYGMVIIVMESGSFRQQLMRRASAEMFFINFIFCSFVDLLNKYV